VFSGPTGRDSLAQGNALGRVGGLDGAPK
jgi:hypothetical protein